MRDKVILAGIAILFVGLVANRVRRYATTDLPPMPPQLGAAEEQELHLVPAGKYSLQDIQSNGNMVPSQKYRGFQAQHDLNPSVGDRLCPITRTKANPNCTWNIGGQTYQFCCPPCIDEFVRLAKQQPDDIQSPECYVK